MGGAAGERQLLEEYLDRYMGTDRDWLELDENSATYFDCLPDAWDGAINSQRAYGGLEAFEIGPLVITYAKAGVEGIR
jgi:hypothetical protein